MSGWVFLAGEVIFPHYNIIISSRLFTSFYFVCYGSIVLAWGPSMMPTSPWDSWPLCRNDVTFYAYQSKMMLLFMLIRVCQRALLFLSECVENLKLVLLKLSFYLSHVRPFILILFFKKLYLIFMLLFHFARSESQFVVFFKLFFHLLFMQFLHYFKLFINFRLLLLCINFLYFRKLGINFNFEFLSSLYDFLVLLVQQEEVVCLRAVILRWM